MHTFSAHLNPVLALRVLLLTILASTTVAAQSPAYTSPKADGLFYQERITEVRTMAWPQGKQITRMSHDVGLTITPSGLDQTKASFNKLHILLTSDQGLSEPLTQEAIGRPFILRFGPKGHVQVVKTPALPQVLLDVSDLRWWFEDFFFRSQINRSQLEQLGPILFEQITDHLGTS